MSGTGAGLPHDPATTGAGFAEDKGKGKSTAEFHNDAAMDENEDDDDEDDSDEEEEEDEDFDAEVSERDSSTPRTRNSRTHTDTRYSIERR